MNVLSRVLVHHIVIVEIRGCGAASDATHLWSVTHNLASIFADQRYYMTSHHRFSEVRRRPRNTVCSLV